MTLNQLFDGIYCINLPSSRDRRLNMEKEFKFHQCNATFIQAISPIDLEYQEAKKNRQIDPKYQPRCYCIKKCKHASRLLRESEIAISLSHRSAYNKIIENDDKISLIVEDDVVFHKNIDKIISHIFDKGLKELLLSDTPIIVFCGGRNNPGLKINEPNKYNYHFTKNGFYSNYCCILNKRGAQVLAKKALPVNRPDDSFKRYLAGKGLIKAYHIRPSLVGELSAGINVQSVYSRLSKKITRKDMKLTLQKSLATIKPPRIKYHNRDIMKSVSDIKFVSEIKQPISGVKSISGITVPIVITNTSVLNSSPIKNMKNNIQKKNKKKKQIHHRGRLKIGNHSNKHYNYNRKRVR